MNYLLAKVKKKRNLFKVLSADDSIYELPLNLEDCLEYNPSTLLEEEQWYKLDNFSNSTYASDFLINNFDSVNHNQINQADKLSISYLCTVQGDNYFFQIINSGQLIKKNWFSLDELVVEREKPIITINKNADALYDKAYDSLYFKKLSAANAIFKGMDQLYREATDVETQTFLANDFLRLKNGYDALAVKVPNRKRIAMVMNTLNAFSPQAKTDILAYIQTYIQVPYVNDAFEIETEDHLKLVLYGIEQRFYTTQQGGERRIANSIITLA